MKKDILIANIKASNKVIPCDLVIKNISVVDVFQCDTFICDVAVKNGYIVGLGEYSGKIEIDGTNKFICPGLIDSHAHIESSMLTPNEYYKAALMHGVTSLIADPHEIANVLGVSGIKFMIDSSKNIPFDFYFMLPSCVPATSFENSGTVLNSNDLKPLYSDSNVIGLAEVMDYPAVANCNEDMIDKLFDAISNNYTIDGHGAGLNTHAINVYTTANIKTDHECCTTDELIEKVRRGMYVLIREGTVAKNLNILSKATSIFNSRRLCLCTDDKHIDDLFEEGSIDHSIRMLINNGIKPEIAIQMATLNSAECYKLKNKGAIAPSYIADFIILDDLNTFKINSVYKNGNLVSSSNKLINIPSDNNIDATFHSSFNIPTLTNDSFKIDIKDKKVLNVIELIPNKLESIHLKVNINELNIKNEFTSLNDDRDLLKISVIERHKGTNNIGLGILKGLGLKSGAIATTITHDSHNLIVCGTNDEDMVFAANELKNLNGGIIVVKDKKVLSHITLEIAGLITSKKSDEVIENLSKLNKAVSLVAPNITFNPFLTLSFLALPVIPDIKITDKGLFDVKNFKFIDVCE